MWQGRQFFHMWVSYSVQTDFPGPLSFQSSMIKGIEGRPESKWRAPPLKSLLEMFSFNVSAHV